VPSAKPGAFLFDSVESVLPSLYKHLT
jgi:hypothetical protein